MRFLETQQRQRKSVLVIQISFRFQDPQLRAQQCRQDLFRSGLPDRTCDPGNFPAPGLAYCARQLLERFEGFDHGDAAAADLARKSRELALRHHRRDCSTPQRAAHMIVSIVTRSVDGDEQLSGTNRARINRDAGHPGQGVECRPRPSTQSASHLCNRPPHKFLKGFLLTALPTARGVFNVLRAPPFERSATGSPSLAGTPAPSPHLQNKRARCQTQNCLAALRNHDRGGRGAPFRDRQIRVCGRREFDNSRDLFLRAEPCLPRGLRPSPG